MLSHIAKDSRLLPPVGVWAVLNPIVGGRALTPPTRHSLGKPLPYQQADKPRTHLKAINLYPCGNYQVLAPISWGYP